MAMENEPFEDIFPIEDGDVPASHVRKYQRVPRQKTRLSRWWPRVVASAGPHRFFVPPCGCHLKAVGANKSLKVRAFRCVMFVCKKIL